MGRAPPRATAERPCTTEHAHPIGTTFRRGAVGDPEHRSNGRSRHRSGHRAHESAHRARPIDDGLTWLAAGGPLARLRLALAPAAERRDTLGGRDAVHTRAALELHEPGRARPDRWSP